MNIPKYRKGLVQEMLWRQGKKGKINFFLAENISLSCVFVIVMIQQVGSLLDHLMAIRQLSKEPPQKTLEEQ